MSEYRYVLGADIGGSHITAAVMDMENRTMLEHSVSRSALNSQTPANHIMDSWAAVMNEACQKAGIKLEKVGLAMPGPFDYDNGISLITGTGKYEALYQLNVKELLAKALSIDAEAIRMKNDAACFLAGETFSGSAKNYNRVIGITLGTGLGSAIFDGNDVTDANLWCIPYGDSIAEDYISTRWFLKRYHQLTGLNILNVKEMTALYDESDTVRQIFDEFVQHLAAFLEHFQGQAKADAIVIGGNIARAASRFLPGLNRALKKLEIHQPVFISETTELAALAGAASCWKTPQSIS